MSCVVLGVFVLHAPFPSSAVAAEARGNAGSFLESCRQCPGLLAAEASVGSTAFSGDLWLRALLSHLLWVLKCPGMNLLWVLKGSSVAFLDFTRVVIGPLGSQKKSWVRRSSAGLSTTEGKSPPSVVAAESGLTKDSSKGGPGRQSVRGTDCHVSPAPEYCPLSGAVG